MNEDQLRALVREAVSRHLEGAPGRFQPAAPAGQPLTFASHASHFRYALPASGGPCLIEPAVPCNHCGYCESHGY
jgi:hypothetical protein